MRVANHGINETRNINWMFGVEEGTQEVLKQIRARTKVKMWKWNSLNSPIWKKWEKEKEGEVKRDFLISTPEERGSGCLGHHPWVCRVFEDKLCYYYFNYTKKGKERKHQFRNEENDTVR